MRVGLGVDAHRFTETGEVVIGGVVVDRTRGVEATSDGDVLAHAAGDALLGAAALGDLGSLFPSDDPRWEGADSMGLLATVVDMVRSAGWVPIALDTTVILEGTRIAPHREQIRVLLAAALGVSVGAVSVKATTTDGLGLTGSGEGLAAMAVAVLRER
jgi:2-C-methyl-D-erythritol 2,4-cyclodiphosphate synthase